MMRGFATFRGKHHIIANEMSNIIFAKQMHHIAIGDASLQILTRFLSLFTILNIIMHSRAFFCRAIVLTIHDKILLIQVSLQLALHQRKIQQV